MKYKLKYKLLTIIKLSWDGLLAHNKTRITRNAWSNDLRDNSPAKDGTIDFMIWKILRPTIPGLVWPVGPPPGLQDERDQQGGGVRDGEGREIRGQSRAAKQSEWLEKLSPIKQMILCLLGVSRFNRFF